MFKKTPSLPVTVTVLERMALPHLPLTPHPSMRPRPQAPPVSHQSHRRLPGANLTDTLGPHFLPSAPLTATSQNAYYFSSLATLLFPSLKDCVRDPLFTLRVLPRLAPRFAQCELPLTHVHLPHRCF